MRAFLSSLLLVAIFALCGCDGDGNGPGGGNPGKRIDDGKVIGPAGGSADPDGGTAVAVTLTGTVTYDRLPVTASGLGLTPTVEIARFVTVEVLPYDSLNMPLATTVTDINGDYTLNFSTTVDFYVRARAESGVATNVDRVFHHLTKGNVVHAIPSPILNRSTPVQIADLHGTHGGSEHRAGAFAILDTVQRLRASVAASLPNLGELDVFWAVENTGGAASDGFISGSETIVSGPFGRPTISLLGGLKGSPLVSDHDEYDETVIAHEWASFLQLTQSRDNNFGGPHAGEELLPNAAYSEGVVTAIGCALLGIQTYRDTLGYPGGTTSVQFELDCESGLIPGTGIGYGNEFQVTRVTWDLIDGGAGWPADSDADPATVGMADFITSFTALKTRGAPYEVAWLASLLQQLIDDTFLTQPDADTLMQAQGAQFPPAGGPDPFPDVITLGGATVSDTLDAWSGVDPNIILGPQANAVYMLDVTIPQAVTISLTNTTAGYTQAEHKLHFQVYDLQRNILANADGQSSNKSEVINLAAGTYIVRVQHLPASQADSAPTSFDLTAQ